MYFFINSNAIYLFFNNYEYSTIFCFRGFRSLQGSVKQREQKKFILYSIYAWGGASILTSICLVMEFVPDLPDYLIKPDFNQDKCWFQCKLDYIIFFLKPFNFLQILLFC